MLRTAFELCGGFKVYKKSRPPHTKSATHDVKPSPEMTEVHKRATRRLILCIDGIITG